MWSGYTRTGVMRVAWGHDCPVAQSSLSTIPRCAILAFARLNISTPKAVRFETQEFA